MTSLADSRFDWERVMRELALVLPADVWLTNLTGTASPAVQRRRRRRASRLREPLPGPALELVGCANGQDAVAGFVSDLKDIDGVTRVGVQSSELRSSVESAAQAAPATRTQLGQRHCRTRKFIAKFQIVAAFDAAPPPRPPPSDARPRQAALHTTAERRPTTTRRHDAGG